MRTTEFLHVVVVDMILRVVVADDGDVDIVDTLVLDLGETIGIINLCKALRRSSSTILLPALFWGMRRRPIRIGLSRLLIHVLNDVFHVPGRQGLLEIA